MALGVAIGAITFTGSVIAFAEARRPHVAARRSCCPPATCINLALGGIVAADVVLGCSAGRHPNATSGPSGLIVAAQSLALGDHADHPDRRRRHAGRRVDAELLFRLGGGGAGLHARATSALIITGALVGSSGAILSYIMCKGMNRSFISVILGGFGGETRRRRRRRKVETRPVKQGSADDAAFIMKNASKVIIVPGYGMAVAQAQHALREMADKLKEEGVEVKPTPSTRSPAACRAT
jgi:NAD(P) transhydrogenase subunit beta